MHYSFYGLTDTGCVRTNNEDAVAVDADHGVIMLADGMGGYNAGEVASRMAIELMQAELTHWLSTSPHGDDPQSAVAAMQTCPSQANRSILQAARANPSYARMGTTLVAGVFVKSHLVLGHIGDSRAYRFRDGKLEQLTKDHSLLQERVDAGLLTREQAAVAPGRNLLTRALGADPEADLETHMHKVRSGDLYLLCSDGLTDMIADAHIANLLGQHDNLDMLATTLIQQALASGGRDNVSVVLARAQAKPIYCT